MKAKEIETINKTEKELEERFGIIFSDVELLFTALVHPSYRNENLNVLEDNQRLEFLGDSVIGLIISETLFKLHKNANEGMLSQMRSHLIKGKTLARKAKEIGLNKYVLLGNGEELQGGREKESILSDLFEAFIGALFLDKGYEFTKEFVLKIFKEDLENIEYEIDWKNMLRSVLLKQGKKFEYRLVKEEGPEHNKVFYIELWVDNEKISEGIGKNKSQAEMQAAQKALEKLGKNVY